jgi:hypothetical protein
MIMNILHLSSNKLTDKVCFKRLISLTIALLFIPAFCVKANLSFNDKSFENDLNNDGILRSEIQLPFSSNEEPLISQQQKKK